MYIDAEEQIIDLNKSASEILNARFNTDVHPKGKMKLSKYPDFYRFNAPSAGEPLEFNLGNEYFEIKEHELTDNGNNIIGKVIVFRNITEQKASKAIIQKQNDELSKLNQQKDKMFSVISHDLRSPFSSIIGLAEVMEESYDRLTEKERKKILSLFIIRSKTTYDLVENLLQWSRLQNSGLEKTVREINLEGLIKKTVKFYQSIATDKHIELTVAENTQSQPFIQGNNQLIMTILRNLTTNAIKFTCEQGKITVSYEYLDDHYQVCVFDTGVGIPPKSLDNLFDFEKPFYTLGTRKEIGSGLGLNLCYEFVKKMGGEISVKSEVGTGTQVCFSLPYSGSLSTVGEEEGFFGKAIRFLKLSSFAFLRK
ncbi:MAG: HAMP domain-containing sensor histidine kinase [Bacteroidales bacterium]|nr:HAMP domain-containing sensor histidine kinase [Bacteroidales bacterium]